jgi:hypothetical protein
MVKKPTIDVSRYNRPANLPGFLVEVMCPHRRELIADTAGVVKMFRHTTKLGIARKLLEPVWSGLWSHDGQSFHSPAREGWPTSQELGSVPSSSGR